VNALAQFDVGWYLNQHFVSAFQKVATFKFLNRRQKQGGNVASYFCTPEGQVLHAVAGPADGATFLREARWANETYQLAQLEKLAPAQLPAHFRKAHLERLQREQHVVVREDRLPRPDSLSRKALDNLLVQNDHLGLGNQGKVNLLLAVAPLPRLEHVYRVVFERILNEPISTNPVEVANRPTAWQD
jgi:hypothetical protein